MRGLMPRVIAEGIASDFSFAQAIREMDDALYAGLPDWIADGSGDPCCLGREATACLLEWEWTVAQREGRDAAAFFDDIRDLETSLKKVDLDDQAMTTFVSGTLGGGLPPQTEPLARLGPAELSHSPWSPRIPRIGRVMKAMLPHLSCSSSSASASSFALAKRSRGEQPRRLVESSSTNDPSLSLPSGLPSFLEGLGEGRVVARPSLHLVLVVPD
jgi:hypothetical protein